MDSLTDRELLLGLYRTTGGPQWFRTYEWNTNVDITRWYGVEVRGGHIVGLSLSSNNLQGPIPREVGYLTSLEKLDLNSNKLNGSFPRELAALRTLKHLILRGNQLTGPIPNEVERLTSLEQLDLSRNRLYGPIPKKMGQLTSLEILRLNENRLEGQIPKELAALRKLTHLKLSNNQLRGDIPLGLVDIPTIEEIDCRANMLSGMLPMHISGSLEILRWRQMTHGETVDGMSHSYIWRIMVSLTTLWHFLLPVLDDITDLWLLLVTSGESHHGLWWACLCVFFIADVERLYTAFFFVVITVLMIFSSVIVWMDLPCVEILQDGLTHIINLLAWHNEVDRTKTSWLQLDSLLWTLFGSRARSSSFMKLFGQAGHATGTDLMKASLGLPAIDVILFFHPMRYLGEFIMSLPRGHRRREVANRDGAERREIAMVRAVGETLCVDPLFLALSVVTGGWDEHVTGLAMVSALFSTLELVTELQYYVAEAEAATPVDWTVLGNDDEVSHVRDALPSGNAVAYDFEDGHEGSVIQMTQSI